MNNVTDMFAALERRALRKSQSERAQAWEELQAMSPACAETITQIAAVFGKAASIRVTTDDGRTWQWPR